MAWGAGGFLEKVFSPVQGFFAGFSASTLAACVGAACTCTEGFAMGPSMLPPWQKQNREAGAAGFTISGLQWSVVAVQAAAAVAVSLVWRLIVGMCAFDAYALCGCAACLFCSMPAYHKSLCSCLYPDLSVCWHT